MEKYCKNFREAAGIAGFVPLMNRKIKKEQGCNVNL